MRPRHNYLFLTATFFLLIVIFLASQIFAHLQLRDVKLDLTQDQLWTLSPVSKKIARSMNSPIVIYFFFSRSAAGDYPSIRNYARRVRGLLTELQTQSQGKIKIEYIDPEPFSEDEDRAIAFGLRPILLPSRRSFYFGLAMVNQFEGVEKIPFFTRQRQYQIEYDLIQMISSLSAARKPKLGLVTSLPLDSGIGGLAAAMEGRAKPFLLYQELVKHFDVEFLEQDFKSISNRIKLVMIAHPKKLSRQTLYAIDQYVMDGGRLLIFLDPFSEFSKLVDDKGQKMKGLALSSNLEPLLSAWGVQFDVRDLVADRSLAQKVAIKNQSRHNSLESQYVLWLATQNSNFAMDEPIAKDLSLINLATSGHFTFEPKSDFTMNHPLKFSPLITSSQDAMLLSTQYIQKPRTPDELLLAFNPTGRQYVLAALMEGNVKSAFEGAPKKAPQSKLKLKGKRQNPSSRQELVLPPHLSQTSFPTKIILVGDSDLFDKRFWIDMGAFYNQSAIVPIADNITFILNAIDYLFDNEELILLRQRKNDVRSFTKVDDLRAQTSEKLAHQEYQLRQKITALERKLEEFDKNSNRILKSADEITRLERALLASRRDLQNVHRDLNRDIEALGLWARFVNILLMPLVLLLIFLTTPWIKRFFYKKPHA